MKCRLPPKKPTEEQEERTKRRMIRDNNKIFTFADMLLCMSMHENAGFGTSRLNHYNNNGADILEMYIKRYTVEGEPDEDYAVNGYYAMVRDLTGYRWDPEKHLWKDDVFASFPPIRTARPREKNTAADWFMRRGSPSTCAKCCALQRCICAKNTGLRKYG